MSDAMREIRDSFFIECDELLEALQDGLQQIEDGRGDDETINLVFRAVHSIKGGAGAFALDQVVEFAHAFETALDKLRAGELVSDAETVLLFFQCGDTLADTVAAARRDSSVPAGQTGPLLERLAKLAGAGDEEEISEVDFLPMALSLDLDDLGDLGGGSLPGLDDPGAPAKAGFRIVFRPHAGLYSLGSEPLFLLRALAKLGACKVEAHVTDLPELGDLALPFAALSWIVEIETEVDEPCIRQVFEFVDGLCDLTVEPLEAAGGPGVADAAEPRGAVAPDPTSGVAPLPQDAPEAPPPKMAPAAPEDSAPPGPAADANGDGKSPTKAPADTARKDTAGVGRTSGTPSATVRVDLERIDRLVNLVGELVINQAMLAQSLVEAGVANQTTVASGLDEFQQLTRDIQDSVMMIRAQPVKSLFQRMARIVREVSGEVGKKVRLKTEGESTEIDKRVIERLADPLTHMIRNAVDHGLESPERRIAAGKPAEGIVTLSASHRSGRVIIEVADDGGGIDRARVTSIAEEKGLIPPDLELGDSEIDSLLFLPGFSTASEVSNLSGRGVGMDVVKNAISALGGRITTTSRPGEGTRFAISLPLTLAVLDGMVVRVAGETLVVPLSTISETLSLRCKDLRSLGPRTQVLKVRQTVVPLLDLATELGYRPPQEIEDGAIVLLINAEDGSRAALVVDDIADQRQVVIKGLNDTYGHVRGVSAATILGDGQIALILDPVDLLENATGISRPGAYAPAEALAG